MNFVGYSPKLFPIMQTPAEGLTTIPLAMIAPHEPQAMKNHGQSLERLAERGGLSPGEALSVLEDRRWEAVEPADASARLTALVSLWKSENETAT